MIQKALNPISIALCRLSGISSIMFRYRTEFLFRGHYLLKQGRVDLLQALSQPDIKEIRQIRITDIIQLGQFRKQDRVLRELHAHSILLSDLNAARSSSTWN